MSTFENLQENQIELPRHLPQPALIKLRTSDAPRTAAQTIAEELKLSLVTAKVLVGRGLTTVEEAKSFLYPSLRDHLPDPRAILNVEAASARILDAVSARRQVTVYTDFDVDGLSSGSQLFLFLRALGAKVNHYTPNRFTEGYGLSQEAIETLTKAGTQLLITVDCGVSNSREIAAAKKAGIETIIVDHHQVHELPPADVVVDPAQEGCPFGEHELCAAGLVWMLLIVLRQDAEKLPAFAEVSIPSPKDFLDLAALGTICDMVPLIGLNRLIASRGIEALRETKRPGLAALKQAAGVENKKRFGCSHVSFGLGPRINAAGRLDDPGQVFELLTTGSQGKAKAIATKLNRLNAERKNIEEAVRQNCLDKIEKQGLAESAAFAMFGEDYHSGVIGIVAQRLVEQYHKPSAVMGPGEDGEDIVKGSVRSIRGFHVAEALQQLDDILLKHGGHAQAGGFSLERANLEEFQRRFIQCAAETLEPEDYVRFRTADAEVTIQDINFDVVSELASLQPFGIGNPAPLLIARDIRVDSVQSLGNGHLRLRLTDGASYVGAVAWRFRGHPLLAKGKKVSIAFQAEINNYRGMSSVQLNIREVWQDL
ncbi:MAG: single-stranded-DNA-specific exonuclease RecJ [Bdellovibrionales bacterium]|nr:single-stranded-DNA-specific exonuclease RecJ [Bdellovibrionales bacterium]